MLALCLCVLCRCCLLLLSAAYCILLLSFSVTIMFVCLLLASPLPSVYCLLLQVCLLLYCICLVCLYVTTVGTLLHFLLALYISIQEHMTLTTATGWSSQMIRMVRSCLFTPLQLVIDRRKHIYVVTDAFIILDYMSMSIMCVGI